MGWAQLTAALLPILKIAATLAGGAVALSELRHDQADAKGRSSQRRRASVLLTVMLGAAVAAELVDAAGRYVDARQMQRRLSSTLRPLLPMRVTMFAAPAKSHPVADEYLEYVHRVDRETPDTCDPVADFGWGDDWFPTRREVVARAIAGAELYATVAIYADGRHFNPEATEGTFEDADLAFDLIGDDLRDEQTRMRQRRYAVVADAGLVLRETTRQIRAGDIYRDSLAVTALDDLAGATVVITFATAGDVPELQPYEVALQFPDHRTIVLDEFRLLGASGYLRYYGYTFPKSMDAITGELSRTPVLPLINDPAA